MTQPSGGGGGGGGLVQIQDAAGNNITSVGGSLNANVTNFPASQVVSGSVLVSNFPATQAVSIASMPSTPVTGTFWQTTQPISGSTGRTWTLNSATDSVTIAGSGGNPAAGLTGAAVPASADYQGWNNGGVLQGTSITAPLPIAQSATNFQLSTANSFVGTVNPGTPFVGIVETGLNQTQLSIMALSTTSGILTINQFVDIAGDPFPAKIDSFPVVGGVGFSQALKLNGNFFNAVFNVAGSTPTSLNLNIYQGTIQESVQIMGTFNQVTGTTDPLQNGDNSVDYDAPNGSATGVANTGLLGAEAYPRFFDGINWQRQRGQIDQGLRIYDTKIHDALFSIIAEVKTLRLVVQQGMGVTENFDLVSNELSQSIQ